MIGTEKGPPPKATSYQYGSLRGSQETISQACFIHITGLIWSCVSFHPGHVSVETKANPHLQSTSQDPGSHPEPKADAQPLSHPDIPHQGFAERTSTLHSRSQGLSGLTLPHVIAPSANAGGLRSRIGTPGLLCPHLLTSLHQLGWGRGALARCCGQPSVMGPWIIPARVPTFHPSPASL